jgi:hypothetical protein
MIDGWTLVLPQFPSSFRSIRIIDILLICCLDQSLDRSLAPHSTLPGHPVWLTESDSFWTTCQAPICLQVSVSVRFEARRTGVDGHRRIVEQRTPSAAGQVHMLLGCFTLQHG